MTLDIASLQPAGLSDVRRITDRGYEIVEIDPLDADGFGSGATQFQKIVPVRGYGFQVISGVGAPLGFQNEGGTTASNTPRMWITPGVYPQDDPPPWSDFTAPFSQPGRPQRPDRYSFGNYSGELYDGAVVSCRFEYLTVRWHGTASGANARPLVLLVWTAPDYRPIAMQPSRDRGELGLDWWDGVAYIQSAQGTVDTIYDDNETNPGLYIASEYDPDTDLAGAGRDFQHGLHPLLKRRLHGYVLANVQFKLWVAGYSSSFVDFVELTSAAITDSGGTARHVVHFTRDGSINAEPLIVPSRIRIRTEKQSLGTQSAVAFAWFTPI